MLRLFDEKVVGIVKLKYLYKDECGMVLLVHRTVRRGNDQPLMLLAKPFLDLLEVLNRLAMGLGLMVRFCAYLEAQDRSSQRLDKSLLGLSRQSRQSCH